MSAPVYTYRAGVRFQKGASAPAQSVSLPPLAASSPAMAC